MKTKLSFLLLALISTSLSTVSFADELMLSLEDAALQGYTPYQAKPSLFRAQPYLTQPLKWPFEKPYSKSRIGNNFVQFQPYDMPGYHMGDDMLLESNSWALAPIDGKLEAGHYAYTDLPNGNRIKQWIAWPGRGDDNYFEIAVIDGNGNRYELHHVNR
ncbi:MAG: hypothetical protein AABZ31_14855, partial [Bdellovibrionota bacterium]